MPPQGVQSKWVLNFASQIWVYKHFANTIIIWDGFKGRSCRCQILSQGIGTKFSIETCRSSSWCMETFKWGPQKRSKTLDLQNVILPFTDLQVSIEDLLSPKYGNHDVRSSAQRVPGNPFFLHLIWDLQIGPPKPGDFKAFRSKFVDIWDFPPQIKCKFKHYPFTQNQMNIS